MSIRDKCDNKDKCGRTGHLYVNGKYQRCRCLQLEINERALGQMYHENPRMDTKLASNLDRDLRLEGSINSLKPHIAGALLTALNQGKEFKVIDAYRLIEIFLEKDEELETNRPLLDTDLLVLLLGFGDPRNRYLPELLVQLFARRELLRRPTWVVMGLDLAQVTGRYDGSVHDRIQKFFRVSIQ